MYSLLNSYACIHLILDFKYILLFNLQFELIGSGNDMVQPDEQMKRNSRKRIVNPDIVRKLLRNGCAQKEISINYRL